VVHLIAIAGRRGIRLPLSRFDELAQTTPFLVNLMPSGKHLMDAFDAAGGVPAVMAEIQQLLHTDEKTVSGHSVGKNISRARSFNRDVITSCEKPLATGGSLAVLRGNLAPSGAIIKVAAASAHLLQHTGRAIVFSNYEDMLARINSPDLPVTADSVLVLQNAGPKGVPGFPEWGSIPVPTKLPQAGVTDLIRISDSRMSGTAFGTVVLHVTPEAAAGGPLGLVQDGDRIELNVAERRLQLLVDDAELDRRKAAWQPPATKHLRGYPRLYIDHVLQADEGCDFDFLRPETAAALEFVEPIVGRS
jgi:dihydroxy-acid dehydratase